MTNLSPIQTIAIIGGGTMGRGIAQVCALAGYTTILVDVQAPVLEQAMASIHGMVAKGVEKGKLPADALAQVAQRLTTATDMVAAVAQADLVIEAAPEDMALKQTLFSQLDQAAPPHAILASNTSSLSIDGMAAATQRPAQVVGMHFFNPVPLMALVEVITGLQTDREVVQAVVAVAERLGKTPVVAKNAPGFIVNRVARAYYGEALRLLEQGVADVATLDAMMRDEGGFKMGPFELMDLIGIDINYAVSQSVYEAFFQESRFKPHPLQRAMVESGRLGRKTGQGFYPYEGA